MEKEKPMASYAVAVVGATGAVGTEMLQTLEKRNFPVKSLRALASARSVGKTVKFHGAELPVAELKADSFAGIDLALFSAGAARSREFCPAAAAAGALVVDNSSAFRMDPEVPLVIPEINPRDAKRHPPKGIIANPNCSTIIMAVPVWPLHKAARLRRLIASTYQATSGAGARAMAELESQTREVLAGRPAVPAAFPHRIAFNLFSHDSKVGEDGYNVEESKLLHETRKIFHAPKILVSATCVRVPVYRAHTEALWLEFARPISPAQAREILAHAPGVKLVDEPEKNHFPMPVEASGQDDVLVGRIREDSSRPGGKALVLLVAGDQILKGAALNAVQIAELVLTPRKKAKAQDSRQ
jgi:aspartate-semialdehyde dehydrogenase